MLVEEFKRVTLILLKAFTVIFFKFLLALEN